MSHPTLQSFLDWQYKTTVMVLVRVMSWVMVVAHSGSWLTLNPKPSLGLLLGTEAPVMTLNGEAFSFFLSSW